MSLTCGFTGGSAQPFGKRPGQTMIIPFPRGDLNRSPLSLRQAQIPGWSRDVLLRSCAALAVKLPGPVLDAAAELLHVLLIAAGVIVGVGAASLVGLIAWRWRSRKDAARAMPPRTLVARAAPPLPQAQRAVELPAAPQRETPGGLHLHFHGLDAAQVAAIIGPPAGRPVT
jgi:hypothetical protein